MQTQRILVGELQLGQTLNHCIRDGKKSEFDLLLAMLSTDVSDQDQFSLNTTQEEALFSQSLNEKFDTPPAQTLQAETLLEDEYSLTLGKIANQESLLAARLQHCLRPDALHFQSHMQHGISDELFDSLSPTVAQRFIKSANEVNEVNEIDSLNIEMDKLILAQKNYEANLVAA